MIYLKDIMTNVSYALHPENSIKDAIMMMKNTKWNTVPVTDDQLQLIGVFTRSTLYQLVLEQIPIEKSIQEYIKKDVLALSLNTSYKDVEKMVKKSKVGTGIVIDENNKALGIFTKTDMISALFKETESLKEQLETILYSSDLGAFLTDNNGLIIYTNSKLQKMLDRPLEEVINKPFDVLFNLKKNSLGEIIDHQKIEINNFKTVFKISQYITIKGGTGYIGIFQNVSEIRRMAEELETMKELKRLLDAVIENAYDGIITIDDKGSITLINSAVLELFAIEKEDVLENNIDIVLPQLNLKKVIEQGVADVSDMMEVQGIKYIVQRIPVIQDGKIIGAIAKIVFRQLNEVRALFKRIDMLETKANHSLYEERKKEYSKFTIEQIITQNDYMDKIKKISYKSAKGRSTILLRGESGTGKELFAHGIHSVSARKEGPFITVNCAAIPDHLLESEFFGYEEGAFTGANKKGKNGKFDLANGGTLFLDEIGDMSSQLQAKLLRVLQEKEFYRVGGTERIRVDVRIIAATNKDLEYMVDHGDFREDLYYRLNVISIKIPSLRNRKEDIPLLSENFIKEINKQMGLSITGVDSEAQSALLQYNWPGNVRELRNVIEHASTFSEHGKIKLNDLPEYITKNFTNIYKLNNHGQSMLNKVEQETIEKVLIEVEGNKTKAAKMLGISRSVLYEKLKKYKI